MKRIRTAVAVAAAVVAAAVGFTSTSAQADGCEVHCEKHPITGQLICTPPCP
ncbi:hypothetical protein P2318_00460 [Myxococcaceae bacterium GXIMD 01537]